MTPIIDDPMLRMPQVKLATGLSKATIYRMIAAGDFPNPIQIGAQAVGWPKSTIDTWRQARANLKVALS